MKLDESTFLCDFCGRSQHDESVIQIIVAISANDVGICNICVAACVDAMLGLNSKLNSKGPQIAGPEHFKNTGQRPNES